MYHHKVDSTVFWWALFSEIEKQIELLEQYNTYWRSRQFLNKNAEIEKQIELLGYDHAMIVENK